MGRSILILTLLYNNYNYGGVLQAYALYEYLEMQGYSCTELNYDQIVNNPLKKIIYRGSRIIGIFKDINYYRASKLTSALSQQNYQRYLKLNNCDVLKKNFDNFIAREFRQTITYHPDTIKYGDLNFDYYIVGGDQVWNPEWTDKNYFLDFAKNGKRIAFSCSAGKNRFSKYDQKIIFKYMKNFYAISVREKNFSELLNDVGIVNKIIADPVFLLKKDEWSIFANDRYVIEDKYIFVYLLGKDKRRREEIKKFANRNNLKIVLIPHVWREFNEYDVDFADYEAKDAGPREFVSLLKNAEFVLTDSFHGTAFSIILERQFLNFSRFDKDDPRNLNIRLVSILEEYNLMERMVEVEHISNIVIENIQSINYLEKAEITFRKRKDAISFLHDSLEK